MNTYGEKFRMSIFGESHGKKIGVVLDGIRPGIDLSPDDFTLDIARRKSGAKGTTPRTESDVPEIVSGIFNGKTTGAPLTIIFNNENTRSGDYSELLACPRPGHADFVAGVKFNSYNDHRGGGHFSGRLTLCLVAAGVVAKKLIQGIDIKAKIISLKGVEAESNTLENNPINALPENWSKIIDQAIEDGNSVGGIIECICTGVPIGLGEPFFESLESKIAHLVFSIPATKGIEFGDGFSSTEVWGSENNDPIINKSGETSKNSAGGINGGISNGNPIIFRVAIKPTPSISMPQSTINLQKGRLEELSIKGRHDACIALRTPVIIEAIAAIALANSQ